MDPTNNGDKAPTRADMKKLAKRLNRAGRTIADLSRYEIIIAQDVVDSGDLNASFDQIGGLKEKKEEIMNLVVLPLRRPELFRRRDGVASALLAQPRGILFFGVPGTGKTLLAKAIAAESGATFINVRMSSLMNKWFGESNKLIAAVFSLAKKLEPSIIFIDEIDAFLRRRAGNDEAVLSHMKSEFMTLWDGLLSDSDNAAIMVLGATNRPNDVDQAVLRRLPRQFEIGLPDEAQRLNILEVILRHEDASRVDLGRVARLTPGYSGSDLKEVCRAALMEPIHEYASQSDHNLPDGGGDAATAATAAAKPPRRKGAPTDDADANDRDSSSSCGGSSVGTSKVSDLGGPRPVDDGDFDRAIVKVRPTGATASEYRAAQSAREGTYALDVQSLMNVLLRLILEGVPHMGLQNGRRDPNGFHAEEPEM